MKIELKIHRDEESVLEIIGESVSVQMKADIVEISPVNGYRCYKGLSTSKITIQGELTNANSGATERGG